MTAGNLLHAGCMRGSRLGVLPESQEHTPRHPGSPASDPTSFHPPRLCDTVNVP